MLWILALPKRIEIVSTGDFLTRKGATSQGRKIAFDLIPIFFGDCGHWDELPPELGDEGRRALRRLLCSGGDWRNERLAAIRQADRVRFCFDSDEESGISIRFLVFPKGQNRKTIFETSLRISVSGRLIQCSRGGQQIFFWQ